MIFKLTTPCRSQQSYDDAVFEVSIVTDDIYRSPNFYDIKRGGGGEAEKQVSFPKTVLYELTVVFQYCVKKR